MVTRRRFLILWRFPCSTAYSAMHGKTTQLLIGSHSGAHMNDAGLLGTMLMGSWAKGTRKSKGGHSLLSLAVAMVRFVFFCSSCLSLVAHILPLSPSRAYPCAHAHSSKKKSCPSQQ